jgi:hypothetical protein
MKTKTTPTNGPEAMQEIAEFCEANGFVGLVTFGLRRDHTVVHSLFIPNHNCDYAQHLEHIHGALCGFYQDLIDHGEDWTGPQAVGNA